MYNPRFEKTRTICLGGLFIALFALAANVPGLSAIMLVPGVPVTLQVFLVALIALLLGTKGGLLTLTALLVLTFCGVPLMSGGRGGPAFFVGVTAGYVFGWYLIILVLGLYRDKIMKKLLGKKALGMSLHVPISFLLGMLAILADYVCGSVGVALAGGSGMSSFGAIFVSNFAFLPADAIKMAGASLVSLAVSAPAFRRRSVPTGNA